MNDQLKPNLGLATTRELLDEVRARIEVDGKLDYKTVGMVSDSLPSTALVAGKRVVRTKTSGDRVYYLDDVAKTRQWVANPDVLQSLGFEMADVVDIDDSTLITYSMGQALYKKLDA